VLLPQPGGREALSCPSTCGRDVGEEVALVGEEVGADVAWAPDRRTNFLYLVLIVFI
jgi:hypothetical protein